MQPIPIENLEPIPIDNTTTPTTTSSSPPFSGGGIDPSMLIWVVIIIGMIVGIILSYRWYRLSFRIKGEDVRPSLNDLDSNKQVLTNFLIVQGGMAIVITFGIVFSIQWILVMPALTVTSSASFIGISVAARSWVKDIVREKYKNKYNLEGEMRDKKGTKRRYSWSNVERLTPYIMDEAMIRQIAAETSDMLDENGKLMKWDKAKLASVESTPFDIGEKYIAILLSKGPLDIEWVSWWDLDMFGDYSIPSAGPILRHISTIHVVKTDPLDPFYKRNEYVHVFAVIVDDSLTKGAVESLEAVDIEKNDLHIGLLKAAGVERKVTAGESNTDRAAFIDVLNSKIDFDDIVESTADTKAVKYADDKERVSNMKKLKETQSPNLWGMAFLFVIGILIGYSWGQNSILSQIYGMGFAPWIPHMTLVLYTAANRIKFRV